MDFDRLESIAAALRPNNITGKQFHVTFAFLKKSKLLAIGLNNYLKPHPARRFGSYNVLKPNHYAPGIHSEISALIKLGIEDCSDITFVNMRIGRSNKFLNAQPCINCNKVIEQVGYKRFYFYDGTTYTQL